MVFVVVAAAVVHGCCVSQEKDEEGMESHDEKKPKQAAFSISGSIIVRTIDVYFVC